MDLDLTRRELLRIGAAGAILGPVLPNLSNASTLTEEKTMEVKLVTVPQAIPDKVYTSERVGISRKTHD
jgi:hypothetical protein